MSFRIENLLKKDAKCPTREGCKEDRGSALREGFKRVDHDESGSILHRTLLNRANPPYYKSLSENYPVDRSSPGFHASGCDRLCYPQSYYDFYFDNDYQRIYSKTRFHPVCSTTSLPTIFPLQYSYYSKRKGGQVRFTANQTDILEKRFVSHKYLSPEDRKILADNLKLSDRQVKTWFQNRRAKWRRSTSSSSTENSMDNKEQHEILKSITTK